MIYLPTCIILIGYFVITLLYVIKNRTQKVKERLFTNELFLSLLFLNAGIMFPFLFQFHSPSLTIETLNGLWLFTSIIFTLEMCVLFGIVLYNGRVSKKNPEIMNQRNYSEFKLKVIANWKDDVKSELGRKVLHFFTCFLIFFFWSLGSILNDLGFLEGLNLDTYSFSYWWIVTIGLGFVIMFQIADLIRLNKFYMLPKWAKRWYMDMRPEELNTFVASTALVLSFVPFIFAPFPIFASVVLITTVADALACIFGKKYGKHHLRKNSKKTFEGFLAGGISTFIIVITVMFLYHRWMPISFIKILIMAISSTLTFLIIDYISPRISDNILNPLISGIAMWIILII